MSASTPARCLLSRSSLPKSRAFSSCRALPDRRPRFTNIKAVDMGLVSNPPKDGLRPYDPKEKAALAKRYTPEQLKVIEAGEEAIDLEDIRTQGMFRTDPYRLPYLDDLSVIQPVVDKRFPEPRTLSENSRWMNEQEAEDEFGDWMYKAMFAARPKNSKPQQPNQGEAQEGVNGKRAGDPLQIEPDGADLKFVRSEFLKYMESAPGVTGHGSMGTTSLAPALPKIPDMKGQYQMAAMDPRDPEGKYNHLIKQTGMSLDDILSAKVKILVNHRVTNQTRLGKISSIYCLAIAGDGQGQLGLGEAKGMEMEDTMNKARQAAIRTMRPIPRYEGRTIFGEVEAKVSACEVKLMTRPPGFGLRCQHNIFEMARAAGIEDLAARVPRGRNKMNTIKAAYQALLTQKLPDEVARGRGKKFVDVRKVYYGGDQQLPPQPHRDRGGVGGVAA